MNGWGYAEKDLKDYFSGGNKGFGQKTKFLKGTDFEKEVWAALKAIPYGETRTYKWVAEKIGRPKATRAVGQALSKNPVPIVVPCHRVVESPIVFRTTRVKRGTRPLRCTTVRTMTGTPRSPN